MLTAGRSVISSIFYIVAPQVLQRFLDLRLEEAKRLLSQSPAMHPEMASDAELSPGHQTKQLCRLIAETLGQIEQIFLPKEVPGRIRTARQLVLLLSLTRLFFSPQTGQNKAESALTRALMQLCGPSGADFRRRWMEDYILSDSVLGHTVPAFVRSFTPEHGTVRS